MPMALLLYQFEWLLGGLLHLLVMLVGGKVVRAFGLVSDAARALVQWKLLLLLRAPTYRS